MRGREILDKPPSWWKEKSKLVVGEIVSHIFYERLFFDTADTVYLHMLVPTQFGMYLNKRRNDIVFKTVKQHFQKNKNIPLPDGKALLLYQESFNISCVICKEPCFVDARKPYQVMFRVIGGYDLDNNWKYEFIIQVLCRTCQSVPFHSLLYVDLETHHQVLVEAFDKFGVTGPFQPDDVLGEELIRRFHQIPIPEFVQFVDPTLANNCYNCGKPGGAACSGCKAVHFCSNGGDKRVTCLDAADIYHNRWLCCFLQDGQLFHTTCILYVMPDGKIEMAPPFAKLMNIQSGAQTGTQKGGQ